MNKPNQIYMTKKWVERYKTIEDFVNMLSISPFQIDWVDGDKEKLYWYITSEFMNSHFKFIDDIQIDLIVARKISDYYPVLRKRIELQNQIKNMTLADISRGGTQIQSSMSTPDVDTIAPLDESMPFISQKGVQTQNLSQIRAIERQFTTMLDGMWTDFINKFKDLFITLVIGTENLYNIDNDNWNKEEN